MKKNSSGADCGLQSAFIEMMRNIFSWIKNLNAPVPVNNYSYCPGWTGTCQGIVNLQNAENEFIQAGLARQFSTLYLVDVVPADNQNSLLYLFDVVGSLHLVNGAKVQVKSNMNFYQSLEKIAEKACINAARFWCQNATVLPGIVSITILPGKLGIYVAVNDIGLNCNLERKRLKKRTNSSVQRKATPVE